MTFWHGNVPFAYFVVDFYKNPPSRGNIVVCRLSWIDPHKSKLIARKLGAFACNPSCSSRKSTQVSNLLVRFSDAVLLEHVVNRSIILTKSVDYDLTHDELVVLSLGPVSGALSILRQEPALRRLVHL